MTKKRIFRCCISFLVICCVLFNITAIPARAAVTTITSGIIGLLFSIGMGIVAVDLTWGLINGFERSMYDSAIDYYEAEAEKRQEFIDWFENLKNDVADGIVETTATVRDAIRHWGAGLMTGDGIEVEEESAPDGFLYYNGHLLPDLTKGIAYAKNGFMTVLFISEGVYHFVSHNQTNNNHMFYDPSQNSIWARRGPVVFELVDGTWVQDNSYSLNSDSIMWIDFDSIVWSSFDLEKYVYGGTQTSEVVFSGSKSSAIYTAPQPVFTFIGDIPGKIQSGEADEDQIYVPERLDVTQILTGEVDDLEAVNDISTQLAEGTLTYEQYLEMTQVKDDTDVGTDVWVPPSDPGAFALDLTQYFPFCIPFDLYSFFECLNADPVTPVIHWEFAVPGGTSLPIDLDLSPFDGVAKLLRRLQLLLFCVGLAFKTRDLIKG